MGWASYREDIASRLAGTSRARASLPVSRDDESTEKKENDSKRTPMNTKMKEFTASTARPLPVIVLADTSGSMSQDGKVDALNMALSDMISAFAEEDSGRAELHVALITFGQTVAMHQELAPASQVALQPLQARGMTPMGGAFDLARELVEDREKIPSRAYTPAIVLVSDGQPNDDWEPALQRLLGSERAKKAQRFALGIGEDADANVLRRFLGDPEGKVYGAADARQIKSFFRWVTMSVTARSRSTAPNVSIVDIPPSDLDELL